MSRNAVSMKISVRRALGIALLGAAALGGLSSCTTVPPTYTDAELEQQCVRRGGWWRGSLIPGYCEFQTASVSEAP